MPRFLHLADVHLGFAKYDNPERTKDFFYALQDAIERYAIATQVDFVLIAGDLFEQRQVLPATLNQALLCLTRLQEANIPVLAIEGNHDHRPYGTTTSWLKYLSDWGYLKLLEPNENHGLEPWCEEAKRGSYIDLPCGVRVIGSRWYGAASPQAIQLLAEEIQKLPQSPAHTVLMFHHGLEGQIARYVGALRYEDFLPLQQAEVDYVALGHIHRNYEIEGWIFNPGSIEANSIIENQEQNPRGVYLVEISKQGIVADLKRDYHQRPIRRLSLKVDPQQTPAEVETNALALVQAAAQQGETQDTITELRLHGAIGFERAAINIRELRARLQEVSEALIFLLKYEVLSQSFQEIVGVDAELPPRADIERSVFTDFLAANVHYRNRTDHWVQGLMDLKTRVISEQSEEDLYRFVTALVHQHSVAQGENPGT
jgi:DNA repair exonuclease SbcCD nuclease subunit